VRYDYEYARNGTRNLVVFVEPHAGWRQIQVTEIALRMLSRHCLARRIPDAETLTREVQAYEQHRNAAKATIDWRFSLDDAPYSGRASGVSPAHWQRDAPIRDGKCFGVHTATT
jgi:hypothetical protein